MNAAYTGNKIAQCRKGLGLTQKELAEKLHVTDKAVSKWERGVNFPDLGLMEALAAALETTPAVLLGLEDANQDEILSTMTEISAEQLEDAHRDIKWLGWGCVIGAAMLVIAYNLFGNDVKRTQYAYLILHCVIIAAVIGGIYLLVKYDQIKKFGTMDICILYAAVISLLVIFAVQFFTGYNPNTILGLCLLGVSACNFQFLFYRIMESPLAKALPLILSIGFAAWHILRGTYVLTFLTPAFCCAIVWIICRIRKMK